MNPEGKNEKNRNDHRHHAVDAFIIANTDDWWINLLSKASEFDGSGKQILDEKKIDAMLKTDAGRAIALAAGAGVPLEEDPLGLQQHVTLATGEIVSGGIPGPYVEYRKNLETSLASLFVSYKSDKRLLSSKKNPYRYSHPKSGVKKHQISLSPRGALHQEFLYGKIKDPKNGEEVYVIRKPVSELNPDSLDVVVDDGVREVLKRYVSSGASLKGDVMLPMKKGGSIPIKSVRIKIDKKNLVELRPKTFVLEGDNYALAIYGLLEGKQRSREIVSFFKAINRGRKREAIVPLSLDGLPLLMVLQKLDLFVTYNKHPDEIDWNDNSKIFLSLHRVIEIGSGKIIYARHNIGTFDKKKDRNVSVFQANFSTLRAVKVKLSITGNLSPVMP